MDKRQTGFYTCIHNDSFTFRYTGSDERNARESCIQKIVLFFFECLCFGVWDTCRCIRKGFISDIVACFFLFGKLREPRFPMAEHLQLLRFFKKKEIAEGTVCLVADFDIEAAPEMRGKSAAHEKPVWIIYEIIFPCLELA